MPGRKSRKATPERIRRDTQPDGVVSDAPIDDSDAYTIVRCADCSAQAIKGGPIVPDEAMCRERWRVCCFGPGWSWCDTHKRFKTSAG